MHDVGVLAHCRCSCYFLMIRLPPKATRTDTLFPYTTLFRSLVERRIGQEPALVALAEGRIEVQAVGDFPLDAEAARRGAPTLLVGLGERRDRKSTRLNYSH